MTEITWIIVDDVCKTRIWFWLSQTFQQHKKCFSKYNVLVQDTKFCLNNIVYVVFTDFLKMNILDAVQDINTEWTANGQDYIEDMDSSPPNELVINVFRYERLLKVVQVLHTLHKHH